jgi:hypothetical protein
MLIIMLRPIVPFESRCQLSVILKWRQTPLNQSWSTKMYQSEAVDSSDKFDFCVCSHRNIYLRRNSFIVISPLVTYRYVTIIWSKFLTLGWRVMSTRASSTTSLITLANYPSSGWHPRPSLKMCTRLKVMCKYSMRRWEFGLRADLLQSHWSCGL